MIRRRSGGRLDAAQNGEGNGLGEADAAGNEARAVIEGDVDLAGVSALYPNWSTALDRGAAKGGRAVKGIKDILETSIRGWFCP